jgi:hypothetical protein
MSLQITDKEMNEYIMMYYSRIMYAPPPRSYPYVRFYRPRGNTEKSFIHKHLSKENQMKKVHEQIKLRSKL